MEELLAELRMSGLRIDADDPAPVLRSALNSSQAHGVWERLDGGLWRLGDGVSSKVEGLTGRALADAMYAFVQVRWPSHLFHYEEARVQLEKNGTQGQGNRIYNSGRPQGFPGSVRARSRPAGMVALEVRLGADCPQPAL